VAAQPSGEVAVAATENSGLPTQDASGERRKRSTALAALTRAALALPGIAAAAEVQTDYLYSYYKEGDIARSQLQPGATGERYEIQSHLFRVVAPLGEQKLGLNLTYESMSGASPWYVQPDANGRPIQAMSGASIREERVDIQGTWSLPLAAALQGAVSLGYSTEDDYEAINGGAELQLDDSERGITWTGGIGYSDDTLEPTEGIRPVSTLKDDKNTLTLYGGGALVLDAATVLQASVNYQRHAGFLSDPYKQAYVDPTTVPDKRPDDRQAWAVSGKLRHHFAGAGAALHLDYRYFRDDWEVEAHTLEAAWHQVFAGNWRLTPSLRYYSQSQAYFYAPYYLQARGDGLASSDYRLSPYGAISARVDLNKSWGDLTLGIGAEAYEADADYALKQVDVENPGLVQYLSGQLRVSYRFL